MPLKLLPPLACAALVLSACTTSDDPVLVEPEVGTTGTRIINSVASTDDQDATVMLIHVNAGSNPLTGSLCTGVMIAPKLVLTARHCVSVTDEGVGCNSDGTPLEGGLVYSDFDAKDLYVFTGKTRPPFTHFVAPSDFDPTKWTPQAKGAQVINDKSGTICNHDMALVVLDTALTTPIAPIRLTRDPAVGETVYAVGWGVSSAELEPSTRQQRRDLQVKRLGPNDTYPVLTRAEFLLGESICLGDSGGPVFDQKTNAVVGITSRGGNGGDEGNNPASTCVDPGADNFITRLSSFQEIINQGFQAAGAEPILEPPPEDDGCAVGTVGARGRAGLGIFGLILGISALLRRRRSPSC